MEQAKEIKVQEKATTSGSNDSLWRRIGSIRRFGGGGGGNRKNSGVAGISVDGDSHSESGKSTRFKFEIDPKELVVEFDTTDGSGGAGGGVEWNQESRWVALVCAHGARRYASKTRQLEASHSFAQRFHVAWPAPLATDALTFDSTLYRRRCTPRRHKESDNQRSANGANRDDGSGGAGDANEVTMEEDYEDKVTELYEFDATLILFALLGMDIDRRGDERAPAVDNGVRLNHKANG